MKHEFTHKLKSRSDAAQSESDFTHFYSLLIEAEALYKLTVLGLLATMDQETDRQQYRLEHMLVRADGIGTWTEVISDLVSGPASGAVNGSNLSFISDISRKVGKGEWQNSCVHQLLECMKQLGISTEALTSGSEKMNLHLWFRAFPILRNKTRGHGATRPHAVAPAIPHLLESLDLFPV